MAKKINPDLDEGFEIAGGYKVGDLRALIREKIELGTHMYDEKIVRAIATRHGICDSTVLNFAFGHSKRPWPSTIEAMVAEVGMVMVAVPVGTQLPKGAVHLSKD